MEGGKKREAGYKSELIFDTVFRNQLCKTNAEDAQVNADVLFSSFSK